MWVHRDPFRRCRNGIPSSSNSRRASASVFGTGHEDDFHPPQLINPVILNLGEDQLLAQAQRVVAVAVERLGRHPLKSRTRGRAILNSRSINSYIRSWRSVTITPIGIPVAHLERRNRLLGPRDDRLLADDGVRSFTAASSVFAFWIASPMPILTTTF